MGMGIWNKLSQEKKHNGKNDNHDNNNQNDNHEMNDNT